MAAASLAILVLPRNSVKRCDTARQQARLRGSHREMTFALLPSNFLPKIELSGVIARIVAGQKLVRDRTRSFRLNLSLQKNAPRAV